MTEACWMAELAAVWEAGTRRHQEPITVSSAKAAKESFRPWKRQDHGLLDLPWGSLPIVTEQHRDGAQCLLGHILASARSPSRWYPPEARSTFESPGLSKRALHVVGPQHLGTGPKGDGGKFPKR